MNSEHKKIGIWGFGVVGKAALTYFSSQACQLTVMDRRSLTPEETILLAQKNILFISQDNAQEFLTDNDLIVPSPGIDLKPFVAYRHKFISELDIFFEQFTAPSSFERRQIIAITGTAGKTTTTSLLSHVLTSSDKNVLMGGNIGTGVLELAEDVTNKQTGKAAELAVLEVSSFQLELCKFFAPQIAIWLNFFPNHLDRHANAQEYFDAKHMMLEHQGQGSYAILPLELIDLFKKPLHSTRIFFSPKSPTKAQLSLLQREDQLIFVRDNFVIKKIGIEEQIICSLVELGQITFTSNLIALIAALDCMDIDLKLLPSYFATYQKYAHRLEYSATINGIDFYNDSKSTIIQSTVAAVEQLHARPIILLVGGLSKGVDRAPLFEAIQKKVKSVICFGKEAQQLHELAKQFGISSFACSTLDEAVDQAKDLAVLGDQVLLSPAGSSYDLFKNYEERGNRFKFLVSQLAY